MIIGRILKVPEVWVSGLGRRRRRHGGLDLGDAATISQQRREYDHAVFDNGVLAEEEDEADEGGAGKVRQTQLKPKILVAASGELS